MLGVDGQDHVTDLDGAAGVPRQSRGVSRAEERVNGVVLEAGGLRPLGELDPLIGPDLGELGDAEAGRQLHVGHLRIGRQVRQHGPELDVLVVLLAELPLQLDGLFQLALLAELADLFLGSFGVHPALSP